MVPGYNIMLLWPAALGVALHHVASGSTEMSWAASQVQCYHLSHDG